MLRASRLQLLAVALVACSPADRATDTASAAPSVDLAAEEQAIRDLDARRLRMLAARDTAAFADHYASDALVMPPDWQALGGRPGVHKAWAATLALPGGAFQGRPTRVAVARSGDLAYEVGSYTLAGARGEERGKYVLVWKKQDGAWKITAEMFNGDGTAGRGR